MDPVLSPQLGRCAKIRHSEISRNMNSHAINQSLYVVNEDCLDMKCLRYTAGYMLPDRNLTKK